MKVSASRFRKSPIKFKGDISTEDLLRGVAEEQKSMLEELGRTLQIMRDVLASLDATRSSVERFGGEFMSTMQDVRAAEERVHQLLEAVKKAGAKDPENLTQKLVSASEDYAKAVRDLK